MGLSSSQARLLNLTARMHQIEYKAARLEAQKLQMANESKRVYEDYLNALDATKIQYKSLNTDGSVTYHDASYYDLCFGSSSEQYGLFSVENGFMYVPQAIKTAYENSDSAEEFASALSNYTPPAVSDQNTTVTPTVPSNPTPTPTPSSNTNIILNMNDTKSAAISSSPVTLTLKDTFNGGDYSYTITSDSNQNATFTYLKNGRLVIKGDNLSITASASQADDIILLGNNNTVNTADGNDKIRIGGAQDSSYSSHEQQSSGNKIFAGSGNDYIQVYKGSNNTISGEGGTDTLLSYTSNTVSGIEKTVSSYNSTDGNLDWIMQRYYGDCQFLSLVNSINNKGQFRNYFSITDNGSNWTVKFIKSGATTTVYPSDITSDASIGDKDISVLEAGFKKLISAEGYNMNGTNTDDYSTGDSKNFHIVSKYVLGIDNCVTVGFNQILFNDLWAQYQNGTVSNLVIGTKQSETEVDHDLGIMEQHAYSVINVTSDTVTVVNPHDNKDSITLKKADFYNFFGSIILYGDSYDYVNSNYKITNGIASSAPNSSDNEIYIQTNYVFGAETMTSAQKYQYFINIYNAIKSAGGCEIVPDNMIQNKDWLVNVINGGFGYLKMVSKNEWVDTSVATNTSLQEISDEVLLKKAEAKYEADMKRIDLKDRKYDTDLAAFDAERNAIKQEMETLKTVAKDNVERTFRLFS